ncbi:MAG: GntR family transcriptional regulator [Pseudonocardia sp.]|nr:GntR family transcriptional regulator [Pseudonocardia sp.]
MTTRTTQRVPKYWLVKEELRNLVDAGDPGTALPTERELAEQLATSRTTVRQAISELVVEGLLVRTQGSGTYVAEPRLVHIRQLSSFTDDLGAARIENRVLGVTVEPATGETARRLEVPTVHRVDRVRIVDGVPLALESARLAGDFPDLAAELDRRGSLYATLREAYGVALRAVEDTVQTHVADPETAELLGVETGHPLLLIHRLGEAEGGLPVEWTRSAYRGDRFRFVARTATAGRPPSAGT